MTERGLARIAAGLAPVALLVQVASFLSSVALARVLGATTETDAYFLGLSVPVLVYGILAAAIRLGAIPALAELRTRDDPDGFARGASELVCGIAVVSGALTGLATILGALAMPALVGGDERLASLVRLTVVELAPLGVLGALTAGLAAVLAARGSFAPAVAVMLFEPILKTALTLFVGDRLGVHALVLGNVGGTTCAVAALWLLVRRQGVRLGPVRPRSTAFTRRVALVSLPLLISQGVLQVNPLVDRGMAAGLGAGSVTTFELGLRLFLVPTALLTASLIAPVTATWAARRAAGGWRSLRRSVSRAISVALVLSPPLVLLGALLSGEVVRLAYAGGAYPAAALHETAGVFLVLLLSLPAQVIGVLLATLFVVQEDARFPMKIAIANVALNVVLNAVFRQWLGVVGIALSTTVTFTLLVVVYFVVAQRRWRIVTFREVRPALRSAAVATASVAVGAGATMALIPDGEGRLTAAMTLCAAGGVGMVAHALVLRSGSWIRRPERPAPVPPLEAAS